MAGYTGKTHRLTGKEYLSVLEWIRDNQDDLIARRSSYTDAAKACSKELGIDCSTSGLRRVAVDWDDITWTGARKMNGKKADTGPDTGAGDETDVELRVVLLESRVGILEKLLSERYSG